MKLSIVIPSLNQGAYLGAAIRSILDQDYPDLEIIVKDGGSCDDSLSVLRSFGSRIRWTSAPDRGQADAINQGLHEAAGEVVGYLNSDDLLYPHSLSSVAAFFTRYSRCRVAYGNAHHLRQDGALLERYPVEPWNYERLLTRCYLCQPATFWRRSLHAEFGYFDEALDFALDYEFWLRLGRRIEFCHLPGAPLAGSRLHVGAKTFRERVRVHRDCLIAVKRYATSTEPVYLWMRKLARYRTAEMGFPADEYPPLRADHRRAFAASVLADAAELGIEISPEFRRDLERPPPPFARLLRCCRRALLRKRAALLPQPLQAADSRTVPPKKHPC